MTIYNPFDTFVNAQGNIERRPFPGNVIPASMMDPIALQALAYFPLPNVQSTSVTGTNNWFGQGISESVNRQMSLKLDHNVSERSRLNGRYSYAPYESTPPNIFGDLAPAFPLNNGPIVGTRPSFVTEFTRTQSADLALERALRLDLCRIHARSDRVVRSHRGRPAGVHEGPGHPCRVPAVRAGRLQPDRHGRLAEDGSPGGRPSRLRLVHAGDGRPQPEAGLGEPVQLPRLRAARLSVRPVHASAGASRAGIGSRAAATRATAWRRCCSAGRRAATSTSTRRSTRARPTGASTRTTTGRSPRS